MRLGTERYGAVDLLYHGPGATGIDEGPKPITETDADDVREAIRWMYPAADVVNKAA
ncbi:hypothetical protein AB0B50_33810 [Streptomyces sp. NPDC041068]|uniref:hypothetical protein n=1 Tax=Streptomyces sp. NPDC041068 TaxID=3155130 RepID=UPI0033EFADE8